MTFHHEYVWFSCFSSAFAGFPASDPYTPLCIERMQRFLFALLAVPILPCNAHAATYTQGTYTAHAQGTYNATYSQILPCNAHAATYTGHIHCTGHRALTMQPIHRSYHAMHMQQPIHRAHTLHMHRAHTMQPIHRAYHKNAHAATYTQGIADRTL